MAQTTAFLSYTRTDDEFHGGYITSFRKMLENAVHVVTGEKTFHVFQDVEGIVIGEQWQKKLTEVIHESSFFVPMVTPLFLASEACRDETTHFLEHEKALGRNDLVLPIYFFTCPKFEKKEEAAKDLIATELASRQMFDWRQRAEIALDQPAARRSMIELAGQIARRLTDLPAEKHAPGASTETGTSAGDSTRAALALDPGLAEGIAGNWKREAPTPRRVLWADDNPDNNRWERRALESYGVQFELALDTDAAMQAIREKGPFAAIISDLGREGDAQAGLTLLKQVRESRINTPYFIYTSRRAALLLRPVIGLQGGQDVTADPDALVKMVVAATR